MDLNTVIKFEWDAGNSDKSYKKHGITPSEAEEIFLDEQLIIIKDIKHSQTEVRFIAIGKNFTNKILFVVFTIRNSKIRIISTRPVNKQERAFYYEKKIKENTSL